MNAENWEKIKKLLEEVLQVEPAGRARFLQTAEIDGEILSEVESLLAFEDGSGDFMSLALNDYSKDILADGDSEISLVGQKIGIYEIVRELGQGGWARFISPNERTENLLKRSL